MEAVAVQLHDELAVLPNRIDEEAFYQCVVGGHGEPRLTDDLGEVALQAFAGVGGGAALGDEGANVFRALASVAAPEHLLDRPDVQLPDPFGLFEGAPQAGPVDH